MAKTQKSRSNDPGLGSKFQEKVNRIMNPDGSYNIKRIGGLRKFEDLYKFLIEVSLPRFLLYTLIFYISINLFFTAIYLLIGADQLVTAGVRHSDFFTAFFFSAQTFTTVGYGSIYPNGLAADIVAMIEAFFGLLSFALATGLLWGRFSKPEVKIAFSRNIILTPYEEGMALMFKMVNLRSNVLLNTKVNVMLILDKGGADNSFNKEYFDLKLEVSSVYFFPLTWTIVHKIDAESPLYGLKLKQIHQRNAEVVILVETFDETFSQTILQKHSYADSQWMDQVKFVPSFRSNDKGQIELYINDLDKTSPI